MISEKKNFSSHGGYIPLSDFNSCHMRKTRQSLVPDETLVGIQLANEPTIRLGMTVAVTLTKTFQNA